MAEQTETPTDVQPAPDVTPDTDDTQDYINNLENAKFVSQEPDEEPVTETPGQTPVADPNATPANPDDSTPVTDPTGTPPETKPETFDFMTEGENGEKVFDAAKASEFFSNQPEGGSVLSVKPPIDTPAAAPAAGDPAKPGEAEPSYEETMKSNVFSYREYFKHYRELGYDEAMAMQNADAAVERDLQTHFGERRFNSIEDKFSAKEKALDEKAEMVKLAPLSAQNITNAVTQGKWGTAKSLQDALFSKQIGGQFLLKMFSRENPGVTFKSNEEFGKALNDYYIKATSDRETLAMLEEFAKAKIYMLNHKNVVKHARNTKLKVDGQNKGAEQQSVTNKQTNASQTPAPDSQGLNEWINSSFG